MELLILNNERHKKIYNTNLEFYSFIVTKQMNSNNYSIIVFFYSL